MENHYPSLSARVQSIFIDVLFIWLLMFIVSSMLDRLGDTPDWVRIALFFVLWGVYEPLMVAFGCTLGQYIKGLRVKRYKTPEKRINIIDSYVRYVLKTLLGWISFLTISSNKERRAIHDLACGSVVIVKQRAEA